MDSQNENKAIINLQSLGLTQNQAKVYIALLRCKESNTAKAISKVSGLAACDVYRVLEDLQNLGLIDTIVASPKEFRAIPPDDAISILSSVRQREFKIIKTKAMETASWLKTERSAQVEDPTMVLIAPGKRALQFGTPILLRTKKRLDAIQTNALFRRYLYNSADALKELLNRKIRLHFIIDNLTGLNDPNKEQALIINDKNFNLRIAQGHIKACILVHDDSDVFISTSLDTIHAPSYWSNNPCVVAVVREYFKTSWQNSKDAFK
jgi:sugar-specific transcriptional regulator TrmB